MEHNYEGFGEPCAPALQSPERQPNYEAFGEEAAREVRACMPPKARRCTVCDAGDRHNYEGFGKSPSPPLLCSAAATIRFARTTIRRRKRPTMKNLGKPFRVGNAPIMRNLGQLPASRRGKCEGFGESPLPCPFCRPCHPNAAKFYDAAAVRHGCRTPNYEVSGGACRSVRGGLCA